MWMSYQSRLRRHFTEQRKDDAIPWQGNIRKTISYQMDGERELIHAGPLPSQVEDTDLGIRNTPEQKKCYR
jgi:hypothetical protein